MLGCQYSEAKRVLDVCGHLVRNYAGHNASYLTSIYLVFVLIHLLELGQVCVDFNIQTRVIDLCLSYNQAPWVCLQASSISVMASFLLLAWWVGIDQLSEQCQRV